MKKSLIMSFCGLLLVGYSGCKSVAENHPTTQAVAASPATQPTTQDTKLKYVLSKGSENWDADRKKRIIDAMEKAIEKYNESGHPWSRTVTANNNPGTPTADANYNGWINFGGQIGARTAMHELAHTMGIGTHPRWRNFLKDGLWTGENAVAQLKEFDGPDAQLHADRQHFWPYGLNYEKEDSPENERRHVLMVIAFRKDLGIEK